MQLTFSTDSVALLERLRSMNQLLVRSIVREVFQYPSFFQATQTHFQSFLDSVRKDGIEFTCVLIDYKVDPQLLDRLIELGVSRVVVTHPHQLKSIDPDLFEIIFLVCLSESNQISTPSIEDISSCSRFFVDPYLNRNFPALRKLSEYDIPLELAVNKACIFKCSYRHEGHCMIKGTACAFSDTQKCIPSFSRGDYYAETRKCPFIRPEDLGYYEQIGIQWYHIFLNGMPPAVSARVARSYVYKEWKGDVLNLLGIPAPGHYIGNGSLDNFLPFFFENGAACFHKSCETCRYCIGERGKQINSLKEYVV